MKEEKIVTTVLMLSKEGEFHKLIKRQLQVSRLKE